MFAYKTAAANSSALCLLLTAQLPAVQCKKTPEVFKCIDNFISYSKSFVLLV